MFNCIIFNVVIENNVVEKILLCKNSLKVFIDVIIFVGIWKSKIIKLIKNFNIF